MQSKARSIIETITNTGTGFVISTMITYYLLPLWGHQYQPIESIEITLMFTVSSLARGYFWRRIFNR